MRCTTSDQDSPGPGQPCQKDVLVAVFTSFCKIRKMQQKQLGLRKRNVLWTRTFFRLRRAVAAGARKFTRKCWLETHVKTSCVDKRLFDFLAQWPQAPPSSQKAGLNQHDKHVVDPKIQQYSVGAKLRHAVAASANK